jgi:polar amino acid transport system substrate-binding protein
MKRRIGPVIIVALIAAVFLTGCGGNSKETAKVKQIKEAGELVLLTNSEYPPFEFKNAGGEVVGLDINLAQAIADELGVKLTIIDEDFDTLIDTLVGGRGDLIISGLTITPEREQIIDFSIPYEEKQQDMIVSVYSDILSLDDLAGKKVAAQEGSTSEMVLLGEMNNSDGALAGKDVIYIADKSNIGNIKKLADGEVEAVLQDSIVADYLIKDYPDLKVVPAFTSAGKEYSKLIAVATQKEHPDLIDVVNEVISRLLADGEITDWKNSF